MIFTNSSYNTNKTNFLAILHNHKHINNMISISSNTHILLCTIFHNYLINILT